MKRRVKKESIVILILSIMVITLSILLIISNKKKSNDCKCDNKQKISEITSITCGDDNDLARLVCNRYRENGYVITFKDDNLDDSKSHEIMSKLMQSLNSPVMYTSKMEINAILKNMYGLNEDKDFGINTILFVPDYNVDYNKLTKIVGDIKELDKVIEFKTQEEK